MAGTPTMRVCAVTENEDFTVFVTTDDTHYSLDVEVVPCGILSDARVKVVADERDAAEIVLVVAGSF